MAINTIKDIVLSIRDKYATSIDIKDFIAHTTAVRIIPENNNSFDANK